jgi:dihydrofolate reductase
MILSIIAALDENRGIGYQNQIPWHLGSDFKSFKAMTMGHHILMGRKTYVSLGKPLPGRMHVVISHARYIPMPENCFLVNSLKEGITLAESRDESEAFVIGGEQIYHQALPLTDRMILTRVHTVCVVDAYFPIIHWDEWQMERSQDYEADQHNDYAFTVEHWIRKEGKVVN